MDQITVIFQDTQPKTLVDIQPVDLTQNPPNLPPNHSYQVFTDSAAAKTFFDANNVDYSAWIQTFIPRFP